MQDMASQIEAIPAYIDKKCEEIENCAKDIEYYKTNKIEYSWDDLKRMGKAILEGLSDNDYVTEERKVAEYQGFKVILPAGMLKSNPFVYLEMNGMYKLEYKITDIGIMIRINNLLEGLPNYLEELNQAKARLEDKLRGLKIELNTEVNYADKINSLKRKLEELDRKLGVK